MTLIKALLVALVVLVISALVMPPASAHTAMLRASPDRDAIAGGSISVIDLLFIDPVSNATVSVSYNGSPLAGQTTAADGEVITYTLDQPLTQPGRYQVNYEIISFDSDFTTGGFFFTFDPAANQMARIEPPGWGGFSTITFAISVVGLAVVLILLALFVKRLDNRRHSQILEATGDYGQDDYGTEDYY